MGKLAFVCMVCLIVAASSLTSSCAARALPRSLPPDQISASETTTSKPNKVNDATDSIVAESDEDLTNSNWEELSESAEAACMDGDEIGTGELSLKKPEVEKPCRRMLGGDYGGDYGSPGTNKNQKGDYNYDYSYKKKQPKKGKNNKSSKKNNDD